MEQNASAQSGTLPRKQPSVDLFASGIAISAITGLGYVAAFAFDFGYCSRFDIPVGFISVSTTNLVVAATFFLYLLMMGWVMWSLAPRTAAVAARIKPYDLTVVMIIVVFSCLVFNLLSEPESLSLKIAVVLGVVFLIATALRMRVVVARRLSGVGAADSFYESFGALLVFAIPVAMIAVAVAFTLGSILPLVRPAYPIIPGTHPRIILAEFGDSIVAAKYDETTKTVYPEFTIFNTADKTPLSFGEVITGPIHCQCLPR